MIYGTYANPFRADSFWNLPIGSGAILESARFPAGNTFIYGSSSNDHIHLFSATDPIKTVYRKVPIGPTNYCDGTTSTTVKTSMRIPDAFTTGRIGGDSGRWAFVYPDSTIPGFEAGDIAEWYGFERCSYGSDPNGQFAYFPNSMIVRHNIFRGDGLPYRASDGGGLGAHAGSGLSMVAGTIRAGELTSSPGVEIPHALKFVTYREMGHVGFRWPATKSDSQNPDATTHPEFKEGVLVTLPRDFNFSSLKTEPGRKIALAAQKYGMVWVDAGNSKASPGWQLIVESKTIDDLTVHKEVMNKYGINIGWLMPCCIGGQNQQTKDFKSDMDLVWDNLKVVINNGPTAPKGPSAPLSDTSAPSIFIASPPEGSTIPMWRP